MKDLAEEFFGTEKLSHDGVDYDSRRTDPWEKPRQVRVRLDAIGNPTPRFPRGLGVVLTADEPVRTGWILTRYAKEMASLFEHFAYLAVPQSLPNRTRNVPDPSYTPPGSVLMHVDGYRESSARRNWDFTQLYLPPLGHFPLRSDPTHVVDTEVFTSRLMNIMEKYSTRKGADRRKKIGRLYSDALEFPLESRVTQITAQCRPSIDAELHSIMLNLQRIAFAESHGATAEFFYEHGSEGDSHLVVPATGLNTAWYALHGRLGINNGDTPLETTLYPLIPRTEEGPEARQKFLGLD